MDQLPLSGDVERHGNIQTWQIGPRGEQQTHPLHLALSSRAFKVFDATAYKGVPFQIGYATEKEVWI